MGYVKTKANRYATATLILPVVKPLWDVKTDETEIPWLIAEKLKERGFSNLSDYYHNEFKDPETGKMPTNGIEFTEYNLKIQTAPLWDGKKDVGGDKILGDPALAIERNPFMGLRSLRYCLARPEIFIPQLKAILRASVHGDVRILFPMVAAVEEVKSAKEHLEDAKDQLRSERRPFNPNIPVGVMVETPASAMIADLLAREVDFFSVGTNDLIQYTMAVDRGNERVANLYQPVHPAILRLLSHVIQVGVERDVNVSVCGEICGEPLYTLLLLGMGLRVLSLSSAMIPEIKKAIRSVTIQRAREVAETAVQMGEAGQTERYLHASLRQVLPMIF